PGDEGGLSRAVHGLRTLSGRAAEVDIPSSSPSRPFAGRPLVGPVHVRVRDDLVRRRRPPRCLVLCRVGVADRVASYPLTNAPWSVERMHASVCAPTTTSRPTRRPDSTASRVVSLSSEC